MAVRKIRAIIAGDAIPLVRDVPLVGIAVEVSEHDRRFVVLKPEIDHARVAFGAPAVIVAYVMQGLAMIAGKTRLAHSFLNFGLARES